MNDPKAQAGSRKLLGIAGSRRSRGSCCKEKIEHLLLMLVRDPVSGIAEANDDVAILTSRRLNTDEPLTVDSAQRFQRIGEAIEEDGSDLGRVHWPRVKWIVGRHIDHQADPGLFRSRIRQAPY